MGRWTDRPWFKICGYWYAKLVFWYSLLTRTDGNGRADYLCIEPNGRVVGYLNMGINNMVYVGQVKRSEGFDRANIRFAGKILFRHTACYPY